jgi:hypothetical protein
LASPSHIIDAITSRADQENIMPFWAEKEVPNSETSGRNYWTKNAVVTRVWCDLHGHQNHAIGNMVHKNHRAGVEIISGMRKMNVGGIYVP